MLLNEKNPDMAFHDPWGKPFFIWTLIIIMCKPLGTSWGLFNGGGGTPYILLKEKKNNLVRMSFFKEGIF